MTVTVSLCRGFASSAVRDQTNTDRGEGGMQHHGGHPRGWLGRVLAVGSTSAFASILPVLLGTATRRRAREEIRCTKPPQSTSRPIRGAEDRETWVATWTSSHAATRKRPRPCKHCAASARRKSFPLFIFRRLLASVLSARTRRRFFRSADRRGAGPRTGTVLRHRSSA